MKEEGNSITIRLKQEFLLRKVIWCVISARKQGILLISAKRYMVFL